LLNCVGLDSVSMCKGLRATFSLKVFTTTFLKQFLWLKLLLFSEVVVTEIWLRKSKGQETKK